MSAGVWALGVLLSGALTLRALRPPPAVEVPALPPALPRPATEAERAAVDAAAAEASAALRAAARAFGRAPALSELEGVRPDGAPVLPAGLPDNPLVPGVGRVAADCAGEGPPDVDWWYCAASLSLRAPPSP